DGFFRFNDPDVFVFEYDGGLLLFGSASVMPTSGDQGELGVFMAFNCQGELLYIYENSTLMAGMRPICQATKLLDADPLVRRMAEGALLVMGSAARDYLAEQRAKAGPALRKAIDRVWQAILDRERRLERRW